MRDNSDLKNQLLFPDSKVLRLIYRWNKVKTPWYSWECKQTTKYTGL